ncbi:Protein misato 1 [Rhizophlyctis rosea]|uniref:Protein misato 1 n=1 Tax=Rhizophlyctis rosea TaxID=64517 RepID=A0AAD5S3L7_9FUNG|nr:Protein misato 1 [Rhizophlyctis rosea]
MSVLKSNQDKLPELDQTASVWSDFNKLYYHPKTMVEIRQYTHADEENQFALFTQGQDLFADADFREDFEEERLRYFVEECDSLQGFNLIADATNGFAGLSASITEYLQEEFPKNSILNVGLHDEQLVERSEAHDGIGQFGVLRGVLGAAQHQQVDPTERITSKAQVQQSFDQFLSSFPSPIARSAIVDTPWPISETFPSILNPNIDSNGLVTDHRTTPYVCPAGIPLMTRLHTSPRIKDLIQDVAKPVRSISARIANEFAKGDNGLALEDFRKMVEDLDELADAYDHFL